MSPPMKRYLIVVQGFKYPNDSRSLFSGSW